MVFQITYTAIALTGLLLASYTDLKKRIIPNKLNLALIFLGLGLHFLESFAVQSLTPLTNSFLGGLVGFSFGLLLYKLGVWAGGDVKLLTAIGTLLPVTPDYSQLVLFQAPVFAVTFFAYSVLSVFPYALLVSISATIKRPELNQKVLDLLKKKHALIIRGTALLSALSSYLALLALPFLLLLPLILILEFFISRFKDYEYPLTLIFLVPAFYYAFPDFLATWAYFLVFSVALSLLIGYFKVIRENVLTSTKNVKDLREGDIPSQVVYKQGREWLVESVKLSSFLTLMKARKNWVTDPFQAGGLEEKDIKKLQSLVKQGKIPKTLKVKKSMAFAPALVIGFIAAAYFGDWLWVLTGVKELLGM